MSNKQKIYVFLCTLSMMFTILTSMFTAFSLMAFLLPGAKPELIAFIFPLIGLILALLGNCARKYFKNRI